MNCLPSIFTYILWLLLYPTSIIFFLNSVDMIMIALYHQCSFGFPQYLPHFVFFITSFISDHITGITFLLFDTKVSVYVFSKGLFFFLFHLKDDFAGCRIWGCWVFTLIKDKISSFLVFIVANELEASHSFEGHHLSFLTGCFSDIFLFWCSTGLLYCI